MEKYYDKILYWHEVILIIYYVGKYLVLEKINNFAFAIFNEDRYKFIQPMRLNILSVNK